MKQLLSKYCIPVLITAGLFLSACDDIARTERKGKLRIVTTTGMLEDAVRNIVKDSAVVTSLMGPGVDPHLYKATQGDLQRLTEADVIVYNGLFLEGKMEDIFHRLSRVKHVIAAAEVIEENKLRESLIYENEFDPHVWFDVSLWTEVVLGLGSSLGELDAEHASFYRENAGIYAKELEKLHKHVKEEISTIPEEQRVLITSHDAFGYFGDAYDIEVKGLQGISTASEYGLKDITNMVDFIIQRKVKSVFVETSVSQRAINAVVQGCRNRGYDIQIGGTLYSDSMGPEGSPEGSYVGMVRANVERIVNSLK